ncbi:MAG: thioredoxin domain-containing protein [Candidatus Aenigmatarchaeota archaeon]
MAEHKKIEHKTHKKETNRWKLVSLALIVLLCVSIFFIVGVGTSRATPQISSEDASDAAVGFINTNLVQPGTTASFVSVDEAGGLYNVTVSYQDNNIPVYVTMDGKYMFLAAPLDITEELPTAEATTPPATGIVKTARPEVDLYVMSFCPYGMQAEAAMDPVIDLLGNEADITVRFIVNVNGDTPADVGSLHGAPEAMEDLRQVCVMKYYDQATFWDYIMGINTECSSLYRDDAAYDPCWKNVASQNGIDAAKIKTCVDSESVELISLDADMASIYGVSGSPTLMINGVRVSPARTPEGYKQAICDAFTEAPAACSQALEGTAAAASGSC